MTWYCLEKRKQTSWVLYIVTPLQGYKHKPFSTLGNGDKTKKKQLGEHNEPCCRSYKLFTKGWGKYWSRFPRHQNRQKQCQMSLFWSPPSSATCWTSNVALPRLYGLRGVNGGRRPSNATKPCQKSLAINWDELKHCRCQMSLWYSGAFWATMPSDTFFAFC